ncbi:PQQ-binding-like beta-propeller repeat protein [Halorussus sp. MSC15.2]|uniref:outer membrane protein assembly factor BamB family protein n=1 Tax=Halorussus sp. MSC15.2 TaxID=2283638 RepID=UPI0013D4854D|nr:PQQ-binding-like beta-propeller repeat protein [Halorussus sp. MSC15.2]NEU56538.1 PQQ-binding-like beta-propeller repeat protein [Halorussus sp. MSC15.2]
MQRRDPARTGYVPDVDGPRERSEVRWRATLSDDRATRTWLVCSAGTVYAVSDRTIHAFDVTTGELSWQTSRLGTLPWSNRPMRVKTSPVLDGERLLVGSSVSLYALDRARGRTRWEYKTNSSLDETLRAGSTVYVSSFVGTGDRLVAIDTRSGLERWKTPPDEGVHPSAYAEGYIVGPVIEGDGSFGAVGATTGTTEWVRNLHLDSGRRGGPCIANDTVYCGTDPVYALNLDDGTTRWSRSLSAAGEEVRPISDGSRVYLSFGETGRVVALDVDTGETSWSVELRDGVEESTPALAGDTLYVGLEDGVAAFDASSGEQRFRVSKPESANRTNSPIVAGGTLYVLLGRTLYALGEP